MLNLKNVIHLKNLSAESENRDWEQIPTYNSVPDNSDSGAPCHVYLTANGLVFWRPKSAVIIPLSELKSLVKKVEPDFCSPVLEKPTPKSEIKAV
jgi:hypothetical protein